jgi:acylphosphatase
VQGVGFRVWAREEMRALGLAGSARNLPDGRVEVVAQGPRDACEQLLAALRGADPPGRVTDVTPTWTKVSR